MVRTCGALGRIRARPSGRRCPVRSGSSTGVIVRIAPAWAKIFSKRAAVAASTSRLTITGRPVNRRSAPFSVSLKMSHRRRRAALGVRARGEQTLVTQIEAFVGHGSTR